MNFIDKKIKRRISLIIKILFISFFIYFILTKLVSIKLAIYLFKKSDKLLLLLALALGFINIYLQYLRWNFITRIAFHINDKTKSFKSLMIGLAGGFITPMRLGEIVGRNYIYSNVDIYTLSLASFVDKLFPLILTLVIGFISSLLFTMKYFNFHYIIYYVAITIYLVVLIVLLLLIFNRKIFKYFVEKLSLIKKFGTIINNVKQFKNIRLKSLLHLITLTTVYYICLISQYAILVMSFSHNFSFFSFLYAGTILFFVLSLASPLSISGIGVREITSIYVLSKFQISNEASFNAGVYLFIINIFIPSLIGIIYLIKHKREINA